MKTFAEFQEGVALLAEKLSDKEYQEVGALLNRDTLLRGNLIKNPTQRQKFATMSGKETFRRLKRNEDGKLKIDRGTEKKIKVNKETVSKNFPELSKKPAKKYPKYYSLPPVSSIDDRLKEKEAIKKKYATEGVASLALKGSSKLIPALMTGIGAAGTIMQIKNPKRSVYTGTRKTQYVKKERKPTKANEKTNQVAKELGLDLTDARQRRKAQSRAQARGHKKQNKTNKKINPETGDVIKPRYNTKLKGIQIQPKKGEAEATEKLINKLNNPSYLEKVRRNVRKEEVMAAPTNSTGPAVPGTGDDSSTVVVNRKKRYIYGGKGSRKMWMNNK